MISYWKDSNKSIAKNEKEVYYARNENYSNIDRVSNV